MSDQAESASEQCERGFQASTMSRVHPIFNAFDDVGGFDWLRRANNSTASGSRALSHRARRVGVRFHGLSEVQLTANLEALIR